jgi:tRNA pseudouridine65 synthase
MVTRRDDGNFSGRAHPGALPCSPADPQAEGGTERSLSPARHVPLELLHADDDLIVVHKPAGLLVHPTALDAHEDDTALDRLRAQLGPQAPAALAPAHRLDKGTSGLLVFACHADSARRLREAFDGGQVAKRYRALVRGWPEAQGCIDHPLSRDPERPSAGQPLREAQTRFCRLARGEWPLATRAGFPGTRVALLALSPAQGRRHQIRRHAKHLGHPLIGDATHGKGPLNRAVADWLGIARLWLHAEALALPHPRDGRALAFHCPPGAEWSALREQGLWQDDPGAQALAATIAGCLPDCCPPPART